MPLPVAYAAGLAVGVAIDWATSASPAYAPTIAPDVKPADELDVAFTGNGGFLDKMSQTLINESVANESITFAGLLDSASSQSAPCVADHFKTVVAMSGLESSIKVDPIKMQEFEATLLESARTQSDELVECGIVMPEDRQALTDNMTEWTSSLLHQLD